ncbi:hypothetical protein SAMN05216215_103731 [Saccharopolyspora shandongensis]|uniref:Uncharacterized protein n=1 Tax=Saccharopolyspora shandongensis TaxID=418495 RepID=A0A1H3NB83_9PSEU|nr:hypothetical protein SAMN05216215_103731 [Saccharopolyspora shandongensis]
MPEAGAGWIGEVGPGPSYLDEGTGGPDNDFTNSSATFMTYDLMHIAAMLRQAGGVAARPQQPAFRVGYGLSLRFDHPDYR